MEQYYNYTAKENEAILQQIVILSDKLETRIVELEEAREDAPDSNANEPVPASPLADIIVTEQWIENEVKSVREKHSIYATNQLHSCPPLWHRFGLIRYRHPHLMSSPH